MLRAIRRALAGAPEQVHPPADAARVAVARSTGTERELLQAAEALRGQLGEARTQEAQTRARLQALEHELRAAAPGPADLAGTDLERLRRACAGRGIVTRQGRRVHGGGNRRPQRTVAGDRRPAVKERGAGSGRSRAPWWCLAPPRCATGG